MVQGRTVFLSFSPSRNSLYSALFSSHSNRPGTTHLHSFTLIPLPYSFMVPWDYSVVIWTLRIIWDLRLPHWITAAKLFQPYMITYLPVPGTLAGTFWVHCRKLFKCSSSKRLISKEIVNYWCFSHISAWGWLEGQGSQFWRWPFWGLYLKELLLRQ